MFEGRLGREVHQSWGMKIDLQIHIVLEVQASVMRTRTGMRSKTFAYRKGESDHYFQEIS